MTEGTCWPQPNHVNLPVWGQWLERECGIEKNKIGGKGEGTGTYCRLSKLLCDTFLLVVALSCEF